MKIRIFFIVLFMMLNMNAKAQNKLNFGWELNMHTRGEVGANQLDVLFLIGKTLNKHVDVNLGLGLYLYGYDHSCVYGKYDEKYILEQNRITGIEGKATITYSLPLSSSIGTYFSASFLFDPIPINIYSIKKYNYEESVRETFDKAPFNGFALGALGEVGIYLDHTKESGSRRRWQIGLGMGYQDRYYGLRNMTIDGTNLKNIVTNYSGFLNLTLRCKGI